MENQSAIKKYLAESLQFGRKITFFNWECPPRFFDNGFVNYQVDLDKIFKGQKIDKYTELPRVVSQNEREIKILKFLNLLGINYRFVKVIADTNAYYLTPESLRKYGRKKIVESFAKFKRRIEEKLISYPIKTKVYFFTKLLKSYEDLYSRSFERAYRLLQNNKLVTKSILAKQFLRTKEHLGFKDRETIKEFSLRTIATYAAEGMVFEKLSQTENFSNSVWLNIEEVNDRTIVISNSLRIKKGLRPLPMLFL